MRERKSWVAGLLFGGIGAWVLYKLLWQLDDDRPPIRVRGGSIRFQHLWGWKEDNDEWKTGQKGGRRVKNFTVKVDGKSCGLRNAPLLNITYEKDNGQQETFRVLLRGGDPRIAPGRLLKEDSANPDTVVHDSEGRGRLVKISAPPDPHNQCVLSGSPEIEIDYEYRT